jgi:hypothetical protein
MYITTRRQKYVATKLRHFIPCSGTKSKLFILIISGGKITTKTQKKQK